MRKLLSLAAMVLLVACGARGPAMQAKAGSEDAAVRDSVIAGMHAYVEAARALDSARLMDLLLDDTTFRYVENQTIYRRSDFARLVGEGFHSFAKFDPRIGFDSMTVAVLTPNSAVMVATFTDVMTDRAGTVSSVHGWITWTWVRRDGRWRLAAGQGSPAP